MQHSRSETGALFRLRHTQTYVRTYVLEHRRRTQTARKQPAVVRVDASCALPSRNEPPGSSNCREQKQEKQRSHTHSESNDNRETQADKITKSARVADHRNHLPTCQSVHAQLQRSPGQAFRYIQRLFRCVTTSGESLLLRHRHHVFALLDDTILKPPTNNRDTTREQGPRALFSLHNICCHRSHRERTRKQNKTTYTRTQTDGENCKENEPLFVRWFVHRREQHHRTDLRNGYGDKEQIIVVSPARRSKKIHRCVEMELKNNNT